MAISYFRKGATGFGFDAFGKPLKFRSAKEAGCALIVNNIPTDGLMFYASLTDTQSAAETGQELYWDGEASPDIVNGIPCVSSDGTALYAETDETNSSTISFFGLPAEDACLDVGVGNDGETEGAIILNVDSGMAMGVENYIAGMVEATNLDNTEMAHFALTCESGSQVLYKNGEVIAVSDHEFEYDTRNGAYIYINGSVCAVRLYNRALSENEIKALSKEFVVR